MTFTLDGTILEWKLFHRQKKDYLLLRMFSKTSASLSQELYFQCTTHASFNHGTSNRITIQKNVTCWLGIRICSIWITIPSESVQFWDGIFKYENSLGIKPFQQIAEYALRCHTAPVGNTICEESFQLSQP